MQLPLTFSQTYALLNTFRGEDFQLSKSFRQHHKPTWLLFSIVASQEKSMTLYLAV